MTNEEIEKALYENYDKTITEWLDCYGVYSYINRLKEACQSAIQSFTRMETLYKVKCTELECVKDKICKETAKEIFALLEEQERQGKAVLPKGFLFTARKAYGVEGE